MLILHPELALLPPWRVYLLPVAAITTQHRPDGLKQQKLPQAAEARIQSLSGSSVVLPGLLPASFNVLQPACSWFVAMSLLSLLPLLSPVSVSLLIWTSIILD